MLCPAFAYDIESFRPNIVKGGGGGGGIFASSFCEIKFSQKNKVIFIYPAIHETHPYMMARYVSYLCCVIAIG